MSARLENVRHADVLLIHGGLETHGVLEFSAERNRLEIVLPPSGTFSNAQAERLPVTKWMLDHLEILPNGNVRIEY